MTQGTGDFNAGRLYLDAYVDTKGATRGLQARLNAETAKIRAKIKAEVDARTATRGLQSRLNVETKKVRARIKADIDVSTIATGLQAKLNAATRDARVKIKAEVDTSGAAAAGAAVSAASQDRKATVGVDADTGAAEAEIEAMRQTQEHRPIKIKVDVNTNSLSQAGTALSGLSMIPALVGGFYTLGAAAVQAGGGLIAMASASAQAAGTLAVLPNLLGVAAQGIGSLLIGLHGIGDAVGAMSKAQAAAPAAAKKMAGAQQSTANAIRAASQGVVQAEHAQMVAHRGVKDAQENLTKARIEAKKHIDELRISLIAATNAESRAAGEVKTAQEHLQDVNWDLTSSPQEKRQAEQDLKDAQGNLVDATNKRKDLAKENAAAQKAGVNGADNVIAAQRALRDANWAAQQSDVALANAHRALAQAHQKMGQSAGVASAATLGLATAMNGLSPAGQRFARFIHDTLMPRFKELQFAVAEALLPPLQRGITAAMPLLDTLQTGLVGSAQKMGGFAVRLGTLFGKKTFNTDVAKIMHTNNRALGIFLDAAINMVHVLKDVAVVAGPHLLIPFAKWVRALTATWREGAKVNRHTGAMAGFFDRARARAGQLWRILVNLSRALFGVGKAAIKGAGNDLMKSFEDATKAWADFANSDAGQKKMRDFFEACKPVTEELGRLVGNLAEFFVKASQGDGTPVLSFLQTLNSIMDGVNKAMSNPAFAYFVGKMMMLAGIAGALGLVAGGILRIAGSVAKIGKVTGLNKVVQSFRTIEGKAGRGRKLLDKFGEGFKWIGNQAARGTKSVVNSFRTIDGKAGVSRRAITRVSDGFKTVGRKALEAGKTAGKAALDAATATGKWVWQQAKVAAAAVWTTAKLVAQKVVQLAIAGATRAWAAAQWLLNAAMSANPIGALIAILIAFGVALFVLYKKNAAFRALVQKVWHAIQTAIGWAWNNIIKPAFHALAGGLRTLGGWFRWLWNNVVKPVWGFIKGAVQTAWKYYYKPILSALWGALRTLGGWFKWLWDKAVKPAWNAIKGGIKYVWDKVLHPILKAFIDVIKNKLPGAFRSAKEAIATAWDKIKEAARKPVAFVVNTVYNKGIVPMINAIPGIPGTLGKVKGFAKGGVWEPDSVLRAARGAVLPGYTPGRDVHKFVSPTGGRLDLSGGEAIMVPQWVRHLGRGAVTLMNTAARKGKPALAKALAYLSGKSGDLGVNGRGVAAFASGGVLTAEQIARGQAFVRRQVGKPYLMGGVGPGAFDCSGIIAATENAIYGANPYHRLGSTATFPWAGWKPGVGQFTVGSTKNYGGSGIGHMAGLLAGLKVESYGGHGVSTTHRSYTDPNFTTVAHLGAGGKAASKQGAFFTIIKTVKDIVGNIKKWFHELGSKGGWATQMKQMLHSFGGKIVGVINDKIPGPGPIPNLFDRGGALYPGSTYAYNGTGKVETVFTNENVVAMTQNLRQTARTMLSTLAEAQGGGSALVENLNLHALPEDMPRVLLDAEHELNRIRIGGVHAKRP